MLLWLLNILAEGEILFGADPSRSKTLTA